MASIRPLIEYDDAAILDALEQARGTVAWTPDEALTKRVVDDFLNRVEPDWLEATIRRDPALYKHMGLDEKTLNGFLAKQNPTRLSTLLEENKLLPATLEEITNEVKTYQGLHAIAFHKLAHAFYERAMQEKADDKRAEAAEDLLLARQISQGVRRLTAGIEIHPGAVIGKNFFIDHGAGVVIGETCIIGDDVFLYHGVTLGASSGQELKEEGRLIQRRHPTIGSGTVISTGVNILGPVTIGDHVSIGADALIKGTVTIGNRANIQPRVEVTHDIKEGSIVVGSLPNIPGIYSYDKTKPQGSMAGFPIYQPRSSSKEADTPNNDEPTNNLAGLREWFGKLSEHVQMLAGK